MKRFEWLDITTSDVAFRAYGRDLAELFANAGSALMNVTVNTEQVRPAEKRHIKVQGSDLKSLLFEFLTELLYYIDAENMVFSRFELKIDEENFVLEGDILGERIDPARHETRTHVKACTYHKMEIKKNKFWSARVILDI